MPLYLILIYIFVATPLFADQPKSSLDNSPSVDSSALPTAVTAPSKQNISKDNSKDSNVPAELDEIAPPLESRPQAQVNYVYDLKKLIIKSKENIQRVNDKIKEQAVIQRNQQREERAREYYDHGLKLSEEGKLDQAREYFEKAIRITEHPEMVRYVKQSEEKLKAQENALRRQEKVLDRQEQEQKQAKVQEAVNVYEEAVRLYRQKKYKESKEQFERVEELSPDFKATRSYLRIIDNDIIKEEAVLLKEQKKEMERQQKEAESARNKEKENWRKEIERKESERKEQVNKQAQKVYDEAVALYKEKKFAEAKKRFEEVEWVLPDYKATSNYLVRIQKDIDAEQKRVEMENEKASSSQKWQEEVERRKKEAQNKQVDQKKEQDLIKQKQEQAEFQYQAAMVMFDKAAYQGAYENFTEVQALIPNYKSTRTYLKKIDRIMEEQTKNQQNTQWADFKASLTEKSESAPDTTTVPPPARTKLKEEEIEEAKQIDELAQRAELLYKKISSLAFDKDITITKRKMEQVEAALGRLRQEKEVILKQIRADEEKARLAAIKAEKEAFLRKIGETYDEAVMLLRNQKFDEAKIKFTDIESASAGYRSTRKFLNLLDIDQKEAERIAVLERTNAEENRLKDLEEKRLKEEIARKAAEKERMAKLRRAQEMEVQSLAEKASIINDDILEASKFKDFTKAKAKFDDLERVLEALLTVKAAMKEQDDKDRKNAAVSGLSSAQVSEIRSSVSESLQKARQKADESEDKNTKKDKQGKDDSTAMNIEALKTKDEARKNHEDYVKALALFENKNYISAKVMFEDLAAKNYPGAKAYVKKTNRLLEEEVERKQSKQDSQMEYLKKKINDERKSAALDAKDRKNQKALLEELRKQKRIAQDQAQRDRARMEALRLKEREKERIAAEQRRFEMIRKQDTDTYDFKKVSKDGTPQPEQQESQPVQPPQPPQPPQAPAQELSAEEQRKAQIEFSAQRRKFLEDQYQKEEQKKEFDRRVQAEQERLNKLAQQKQEEQRRKDQLRQQKEQEAQKRAEMINKERQARIQQKQLEQQRLAQQNQIIKNTNLKYNEALRLYKAGDYASAMIRFKEVDKIVPDYKKTRQYIQQSQTSLSPGRMTVPAARKPAQTRSLELPPIHAVPASTPAVTSSSRISSRESEIQKTLDVFDTNVR